jgi:hypothetical protein
METAHAESATPAAERSSFVAWIALALLIALAGALILYLGRGLTFFRDEWTFVLYRDGHSIENFTSNYAGHLLLWPTGIFALMFRTIGLDHYEAYRAMALPWHLLCGLLVYLLARRRIGGAAALAPAAVILFLGSSWMDILWPFQISFTGAIAFGLAALLLLDRDDLLGDALACLSICIALGWSGAGLPFVPGIAVGLLLRRRLLSRTWVFAIPSLLYLAWLAKAGGEGIDYAANLVHVPDYLMHMVGAAIAAIWGFPYAWAPRLAAVAAALVAIRLWQLGRDSILAWEALATGATFWVLTALSRAQENDPGAVRYVYPSVVFLLLLAVGLAPRRSPGRLATATVLALAALALPSNISKFEDGRDDLLFTSNVTSAELGSLQLAREVVDPEFAPEMNAFVHAVPAAAFFFATDRYGSSPADSPAEIAASPEYARHRADRTSIEALRVRLLPAPAGLRTAGAPPSVASDPRFAVRRSGGCLKLRGSGWSPEVTMPSGGLLIRTAGPRGEVRLRRFASDFVGPLPTRVGPGRPALLRIAEDAERSRPWHFQLDLDGGAVLCALSA